MDNRALNNLLKVTDEQIRIWNIHRLYGILLCQGGEVIEVNEVRPNEYEVVISVEKHEQRTIGSGQKGVFGRCVKDVTWFDTVRITLKPPIDS